MTALDLLTVVSSGFKELAMDEVCWERLSIVSVSQINDGPVASRKEDGRLDLLKEVGEKQFELSELNVLVATITFTHLLAMPANVRALPHCLWYTSHPSHF